MSTGRVASPGASLGTTSYAVPSGVFDLRSSINEIVSDAHVGGHLFMLCDSLCLDIEAHRDKIDRINGLLALCDAMGCTEEQRKAYTDQLETEQADLQDALDAKYANICSCVLNS